MYVNVSRYKGYARVRLMHKVLTDGVRKTLLVEHIGSARSDPELAVLRTRAKQRLDELRLQLSLLTELESQADFQATDTSRLAISGSFASGLWQVMGGLYDQLGLPDELLKYLVLARIATPKSKRATARYLKDNLRLSIGLQTIYDYMDSLDKDQLMATILSYSRQRALATTGQTISVVFYDVTTLYFETDEDDPDSEVSEVFGVPETMSAETGSSPVAPVAEKASGEFSNQPPNAAPLQSAQPSSTIAPTATAHTTVLPGLRKKGYSKDHRFDLPQIVVGLTVDGQGFPLDFQVYEGNTYEGSTLLDGVRSMQTKLQLTASKLTVVADAGMLSRANLEELERLGYSYIVGARIRSSSAMVAETITARDYAKEGTLDTTLDGRRMIVTYSEKRAERSQKNRQRLVAKLQAKLDRGQVVKKSKYVTLTGKLTDGKKREKLTGIINQAKLEADARFDGLKGYVTNTTLSASEVVEYYGRLWRVEKAFRMSKSDLRIRPAFHYKRQRIIAHLVICVCALAVLREFEAGLQTRPMLASAPAHPAKPPKPKPRPGLSIALEQLLAIREYQLKLPNQQQVSVQSELTEVQAWLLRGHKPFGK